MPLAALLALSLVWSFDSLKGDQFPGFARQALPAAESQALEFGMLALASFVAAARRKAPRPHAGEALDAVLTSLALFVSPALLTELAGRWVPDLARVAVFSLTPVLALVLEPYWGAGARMRGGLAAALTAVAGTLCVFPVDLPRSGEAALGFGLLVAAAASIAAANCRAVRLAQTSGRCALAVIAAASAALGWTAAGAASGQRWQWPGGAPQLAQCGLDLAALVVLVWLLGRMSAARLTTRFLLAPLLANLAALALYQPTVNLRAGIGLALIAAGAGWMLAAPDEMETGAASPLRLHQP